MMFQLLLVLFLAKITNGDQRRNVSEMDAPDGNMSATYNDSLPTQTHVVGRNVSEMDAPDGNMSATSNDSLPTQTHVIDSCGTAPAPSSTRSKRIIGGNFATRGSWPWLVSIKCFLGSQECGGTVVSQRWVLSAAHCFQGALANPIIWRVWIGDHHLLEDDGERVVQVDDIIFHPRLEFANDIYLYDVALLHLKEDAMVEPICLPSIQEIDGHHLGKCWTAGWGRFVSDDVTDGKLRHISGPLIPLSNCSQLRNISVPKTAICFGNETSGICPGDSGGPLMCQDTDGGFTLEGVAILVGGGCNGFRFPSVFESVRVHLSWMLQHINHKLTD